MAQFTKYSSGDVGAPVLSGTAGALIGVLDACLVTGYGAKAAAGWSHPIATASNIASYQQGAGAKAGYTLVINDAGPGAAGAIEARATGWKSITALTGIGVGKGQFPTPSQLLTVGAVAIRKSSALDATSRNWVVYADDRTFYLFVNAAGTTTRVDFGFGEFYSLWGAPDVNNCFIVGRTSESSATISAVLNGLDKMQTPAVTNNNLGSYFADSYAGVSGSMLMYPCGDPGKSSVLMTATAPTTAIGAVQTPNAADSAYYLAPFSLLEPTWGLRGRFRGLAHICHPLVSITDGASITGTGDFAGRTFEVINPTGCGGMLAVEVSDTLETN